MTTENHTRLKGANAAETHTKLLSALLMLVVLSEVEEHFETSVDREPAPNEIFTVADAISEKAYDLIVKEISQRIN